MITGASQAEAAILIVDAHEGTIKVESPYEEGKPGTKFTITIPRSMSGSRIPRGQPQAEQPKDE